MGFVASGADVFISYARANNEVDLEQKYGIVSQIVSSVRRGVLGKLGSASGFDFFFDEQLRANAELNAALKQRLDESQLLLVLMSSAYMKSKRCKMELDYFLDAIAHKQHADKRVFVLELEKVDRADWPQQIRSVVSQSLWHEDPLSKRVRTVSPNEQRIGTKNYYETVDFFSGDLAAELEELVQLPTLDGVDASKVVLVQPNDDAPSQKPTTKPGGSGGRALETWQQKLDFLLEQEAIVSDPAQKFALQHQIDEARRKIEELRG